MSKRLSCSPAALGTWLKTFANLPAFAIGKPALREPVNPFSCKHLRCSPSSLLYLTCKATEMNWTRVAGLVCDHTPSPLLGGWALVCANSKNLQKENQTFEREKIKREKEFRKRKIKKHALWCFQNISLLIFFCWISRLLIFLWLNFHQKHASDNSMKVEENHVRQCNYLSFLCYCI